MANSTIEDVQETEKEAKKMIEDAEKAKADKIAKANERARAIVSEAEQNAKEFREAALKQANSEIAKSRDKSISEAKEVIRRISGTKVSKEKMKKAAARAIKEITS